MATTDPFVAPTVPECIWPTVTNEALQSSPLLDFPCAKWTSELVSQAGRCVGVDITSLHREVANIRELTGNVCYNLHCHINELRTESMAMNNELNGYKQDADAVKESITQIQTQISKLMSELPLTSSCSNIKSRKEAEIGELRATLAALRLDVDGLLNYERHNTLIATMEAQIAHLQSENALCDAQMREIDQREEVKRLGQDNMRLEARLRALEEKEGAAKAAVVIRDQIMKAYVDRIQNSHDELQTTVSALREDIIELKNVNPGAAITQLEKDVEECNDQTASLQIRCQEAEKKASHDFDMVVQLRPSMAQILHETKEQRAVCAALRSDHEALQTSVKDSVDMLFSKTKVTPSRTEINAIKDAIALLESKLLASSPVDSISLIHQDIDRVKHILRTPTAKFVDGERSIVHAFLELFCLLDQTCAICRGLKETRDCATCNGCAPLLAKKLPDSVPQSLTMSPSALKPEPVKHVKASAEEHLIPSPPASTTTASSEATVSSISGPSISTRYDRDWSPLTAIDEKEDEEGSILASEERRSSARKRTQRTFEGPSQLYRTAKRRRLKGNRAPQGPLWPPKTPKEIVPAGMISCDKCHGWLHNRCASLTLEEVKAFENPKKRFVCPFCIVARKWKEPYANRTPQVREVCIREDCTTIRDNNTFFVDSILGRFRADSDHPWRYLIKWDGYSVEASTWEDGHDFMLSEDRFFKQATKEGFDISSALNFVLAEAESEFGLENTKNVIRAAGGTGDHSSISALCS